MRLNLAGACPVNAGICDVAGRLVRNLYDGALSSGPHVLPWDRKDSCGRSVAAGIYWIRVRAGQETRSERVVVLR